MIHFVDYLVQFSFYAKAATPSLTDIVRHLVKSLKLRLSVCAGRLHLSNRIGAESIKVALFKLALIHFVENKSVININCNNSTTLNAHNHIALTLKEARNRSRTHLGLQ